MPEKSLARSNVIAELRKYGATGEGEDHKKLKLWLRDHPEVLGLARVVEAKVERQYISGDRADLVFRHSAGDFTVVEVETLKPEPGAHQVIKYRALLCAEMGWAIESTRVKGILVAPTIPNLLREFCDKYGVGYQEHSVP